MRSRDQYAVKSTEFIAHRIETIQELKAVPTSLGVEVDLRDHRDKIILSHDPFQHGEDFQEFLKEYQHGTLVLNIKSERIEDRILEMLKRHNIKRYFFLDSSFPMIIQLTNKGEKQIAVRYSEFESLESALKLTGRVNWVWVDCFTILPLGQKAYIQLKKAGFKICLVSPDLVGRSQDIATYRYRLLSEKILLDAICCKLENIGTWQNKDGPF
jgi:hypothetical protein